MENRKKIRLNNYNYSQNGSYFITICTKDRQCIFWKDIKYNFVGASIARPRGYFELSDIGIIARDAILNIPNIYDITIDDYVIMPNHIHI